VYFLSGQNELICVSKGDVRYRKRLAFTSVGLNNAPFGALLLSSEGEVWEERVLPFSLASSSSGTSCSKREDLQNIVSVACGWDYFLALNEKGHVFSWGISQDGALGRSGNGDTPERIGSLEGVVTIGCSSISSIAVTASGDVYTWGYNMDGRTGHRERIVIDRPKKLRVPTKNRVISVTCTRWRFFLLDEEGYVYQCDDPITQLNIVNVVALFAGERNAYAIKDDGSLFILPTIQEVPYNMKNVVKAVGTNDDEKNDIIFIIDDSGKLGLCNNGVYSPVNVSEPVFLTRSNKELALKVFCNWKIIRFLFLASKSRGSLVSMLPRELLQLITERICT